MELMAITYAFRGLMYVINRQNLRELELLEK